MLVHGEIDVLVHPEPSTKLLGLEGKVRRLFPETRNEILHYFKTYRCFPIMHVFVFPSALVEQEPWLPKAMIGMWEEAKRQSDGYYEDPGFLQLALASNELEFQRKIMGPDLYPSGLAANREYLEWFINEMADQELIASPFPVERLFHQSVWDT